MGEYCSYCEMQLDASLAVEHIQPQARYEELKLEWTNFLLACTNCNSTKGNTDVVLEDYFWPHLDNTFLAFRYTEEGIVRPALGLSEVHKVKALATIDLMGLARKPNRQTASDRRWLNRREVWIDANDAKQDLAEADLPVLRKRIVAQAQAQGYWSIWMTVFADDEDMLIRLINAQKYRGTATECFDEHGKAISRVGGQL